MSSDDQRESAISALLRLASLLDVGPADLAGVSFDEVARLHASDPFVGRRVATPKRRATEAGFMATAPFPSRASSDYTAAKQGTDK